MPEPTVSSVLRGGGEMGALMRAVDWSRTAVGPVETWPQSLRTALSILLETGFPMYIAWGPSYTGFYNDGYRPILGSTKHPAAMGASTRQTFAEIWDIIGPMFAGVMEGTPTTVVDFLLPLDRHGFTEECYFIFSYSPIRQEDGTVGGILVTVTETTSRVIGERRLKTTQALAARTRQASTVSDACAQSAAVLGENAADVPFALVYVADGDGVSLAGACGVAGGTPVSPARVPLHGDHAPWAFADVLASREARLVDLPGDWPGEARRAFVLPIVQQGEDTPAGVLIAGLSPRLMFDSAYGDFLTLVASQIGTAIASAHALEEAQARADALAALDRAKTAFFNNVSHELRTPLTLILGPVEQALASADASLRGADLDAVYRNAIRLLRLVNTLLDFSRIEAGRVHAIYEPTDLAALTADLASAFRSATERAGLTLVVDCPPLPAPVYVDRDMWEKVVLNLLSNAFKYTFQGSITVGLAWRGSHVDLTVRDTGAGIAEAELPHIFDRFHRVERARARTHEGSGIGLALVRELVALHGGTVSVESAVGEGTTFTVSVATGTAHLPQERIRAEGAAAPGSNGAVPYVEEALRWLPEDASLESASHGAGEPDAALAPEISPRILVADDNADMRDYIARLLGERWTVRTVADGQAALASALEDRPDVIVADVMMPGLDGLRLVQALRADERTRGVPVILLSARAGEEARVEGLNAGADDYLAKPFAARELMARVQAQVLRSKMRSLEEAHALRLASIFSHAPVGLAILRGPAHVFDFANDVYLEMIGRRPILGRPIREALPEVAGQGLFELLDEVYATARPHIGRSVRVNLRRRGAGDEETFFDFVYQPLVDGGTVSGIAVVCFDVSELARARRDAEAANRAKDEFLAMLGHELRNPLAPILTALQLIRLRGVQGAAREHSIIERQVKHLVGLVDDLLDVSRITRGKVQLRPAPVEIADIVAKAIEMTGPVLEERRHTLSVDVPRGLVVNADAARLAQVLANLLTNAAKYTDPGGSIAVTGTRRGRSIDVAVKDNGSGIAPEMLPHVFDLFTQGHQAIERSRGGLGLGLAIVRSLVEAHGGRASVASDGLGHGSTFAVSLPAMEAGLAEVAGAAAAPDALVTAGTHVLLVDDNVDAADMLADSLRALGHLVHVAHDGVQALEVVRRFVPAVALLDLGLPVMDGFELAQQLRRDPRLARVALIAITGYGQDVDRRRTDAAGFQAHLVKPVDVHALDALIRAHAREV